MAATTKVPGKLTRCTGRVCSSGQMASSTMATISLIRNMDMEISPGPTGLSTEASGRTVRCMGGVFMRKTELRRPGCGRMERKSQRSNESD